MRYIVLSALLLMAFPAYAESDHAFCERYMAEYMKKSAQYVPGVDVKGKPVAPADLPPEQGGAVSIMPEKLEFNLTVDAAQYLGVVPQGVEMQGKIGTITLEGNKVFYNGEPLNQTEEERLFDICKGDDEGGEEQ